MVIVLFKIYHTESEYMSYALKMWTWMTMQEWGKNGMYTMRSVVLGMYFLHIFSGTVPKSQRVASTHEQYKHNLSRNCFSKMDSSRCSAVWWGLYFIRQLVPSVYTYIHSHTLYIYMKYFFNYTYTWLKCIQIYTRTCVYYIILHTHHTLNESESHCHMSWM